MGKPIQKPAAPRAPKGTDTGSGNAPAAGAGVSSQEAAPAQSSSVPEADAAAEKPIDDAAAFDAAFGKEEKKEPWEIQNGPVQHHGMLYRDGEIILLTEGESAALIAQDALVTDLP